MAYRAQHQGLVLSRTGSPAIDMPLGVEEIGRQLSERSCATASAVAGSLSEDALARLLLSDTLADATRLLEAAPRLPPVTAEPANRRFERPKPDDVTSAQNMGATCRSEAPPTSRRTSANIATLES